MKLLETKKPENVWKRISSTINHCSWVEFQHLNVYVNNCRYWFTEQVTLLLLHQIGCLKNIIKMKGSRCRFQYQIAEISHLLQVEERLKFVSVWAVFVCLSVCFCLSISLSMALSVLVSYCLSPYISLSAPLSLVTHPFPSTPICLFQLYLYQYNTFFLSFVFNCTVNILSEHKS